MITKIINAKLVEKARTYINKGKSFAIVTHFSPDGDALGSALALFHLLKKEGKQSVTVVVPNQFPDCFNWMPGIEHVLVYNSHKEQADKAIADAEVIFCLDFNSIKRIDKVAESVLNASGRKVMIDHHLHPGDFCRLVISHPEMSSTCELMFRFFCALGMYDCINKEIAECLYTGIMTDTGSFAYNSNNPETFVIVSKLMEIGVDKDFIFTQINQVYSEARLRMMGYVLYEKMKIYPDKQAALVTLNKEELARFGYKEGDTEGFANLPLDISGIRFSVFLREDNDYIKVSLRSTGNVACNTFSAAYFNGGGHKNASGGEVYATMQEAIEIFEKGLAEFSFE